MLVPVTYSKAFSKDIQMLAQLMRKFIPVESLTEFKQRNMFIQKLINIFNMDQSSEIEKEIRKERKVKKSVQ